MSGIYLCENFHLIRTFGIRRINVKGTGCDDLHAANNLANKA